MKNAGIIADGDSPVSIQMLGSTPGTLPSKVWGDAPLLPGSDSYRKVPKRAPTAKQAELARVRLVAQLRDAGADKATIIRLNRCRAGRGGEPCQHGLCPACSWLFSRWLAWTGLVAMRRVISKRCNADDPGSLTHLALLRMTATERVVLDERSLTPKNIDVVINGLRNVLSCAGITVAVGAINLKGIRDDNSGFGLDLQAELLAIVLIDEATTVEFRKAIRCLSPRLPDRRRDRPVHVRPLVYNPTALLGLMSAQPMVRGIQPGPKKRTRARGRAKQSKRRMSPSETVEMLSVFSRLGMADRIFVHGARVTTNKRQRLVVRPKRESLRTRSNDALVLTEKFWAELDD